MDDLIQKVMTPHDASRNWGVKENTLRAGLNRGKFINQIERGLVRKSGSTWLIHEKAMIEVYGEKPKKTITTTN